MVNARWIGAASLLLFLSLLLKIGVDDLRNKSPRKFFAASFQAQNQLLRHLAKRTLQQSPDERTVAAIQQILKHQHQLLVSFSLALTQAGLERASLRNRSKLQPTASASERAEGQVTEAHHRQQAILLKNMLELMMAYKHSGPDGPLKRFAADHIDDVRKIHQDMLVIDAAVAELSA